MADMVGTGKYLLVDEASIKTNTNQYEAKLNGNSIELTQTNTTQISGTKTVNLTFDVYDLFGHKTQISIPVKYEAVADK